MARNPWDDDPDVAAMRSIRPSGGGGSWTRVLFGVLLVGCGTFGLAYYLPLYRAHASLVSDHARLRGELENAASSLKQVQGELKTAEERRAELETERDKHESAKKSDGAGSQALVTALSSALDKPLKKKQALVGSDEAGVRVALASSFTFSTGKVEVGASGKDALCAIAKASGSAVLRVSGVAGDDDVPAALKAKLDNAWAYTGAIAASVAETLETKCSVPKARLSAGGTPGAAAGAFAGQSPPTPRVEILLEASAKKP